MSASDLVDLAYTPAERKEEAAEMKPSSIGSNIPKYPYGLTLSLNDETLAKLKLKDDLPDVGDEIQFHAVARVTSVSQRADESDDNTSVELQVCQMALQSQTNDDLSADSSAAAVAPKPARTVASYSEGV